MKRFIITALAIMVALAAYFLWAKPQRETPIRQSPATITYRNDQYGFKFTLPASWQGYTIATATWTGYVNCPSGECPKEKGPEIKIRNPQWTPQNNWQPIPIMVFTLDEWNRVASGTLIVSAAPFPPFELGRNARYVFALPPRYNYAFPQGYQEVEAIMQRKPLHAF